MWILPSLHIQLMMLESTRVTHRRWWSSVWPGPSVGRPARDCVWSTARSGWCRYGNEASWGRTLPSPLRWERTPPPPRSHLRCAWGGRRETKQNRERRGLLLWHVLVIDSLLKTAVPESDAGDKTLYSHNRRLCYFFFFFLKKVKCCCVDGYDWRLFTVSCRRMVPQMFEMAQQCTVHEWATY